MNFGFHRKYMISSIILFPFPTVLVTFTSISPPQSTRPWKSYRYIMTHGLQNCGPPGQVGSLQLHLEQSQVARGRRLWSTWVALMITSVARRRTTSCLGSHCIKDAGLWGNELYTLSDIAYVYIARDPVSQKNYVLTNVPLPLCQRVDAKKYSGRKVLGTNVLRHSVSHQSGLIEPNQANWAFLSRTRFPGVRVRKCSVR